MVGKRSSGITGTTKEGDKAMKYEEAKKKGTQGEWMLHDMEHAVVVTKDRGPQGRSIVDCNSQNDCQRYNCIANKSVRCKPNP